MFDFQLSQWTRRTFLKGLVLGGVVIALEACDAFSGEPETPEATSAPRPTNTPAFQSAQVNARIFLEAWGKNNFPGMYAVLAPSTQTKISQEDFVNRYQGIVQEATIQKITPTLTHITEEGATATAQFHVKYDTSVLGPIEQDNVFSLIREQGKWGIIWSPRLIFQELENNNRLKLYVTKSTRGNVYDRSGAPIAIGVKAIVVNIWPAEARRHDNEAQVVSSLASVLGLTEAEVQKRYAGYNSEWKIPIQTISQEMAQANAEALSLPGVVVEEQDARQYPLAGAAGHVAGYVGEITSDELGELYGQGYREGEYFGRAGLEHLGEKYLSGGRGGKLVALNTDGAQAAVIAEKHAEQSQSVYSTIDADLQTYLSTLMPNLRGSITVMDVHNGNILGMYSNPGFDSNAFVDHERNDERANYLTSPQKIMLNRSAQGSYPHGSVQKVITTATALERGGMTQHTPFNCTGTWTGIGYPKSCWITSYGKTHGTIGLQDALTQSCDIAFYQTGLILHDKDPMLLTDFCHAFGLGSETGIGLEESAGNVPDPTKQDWIPTDSTDSAIGQDTFLVSPLQVVDFIAAVANGGALWRPNLILKAQDFVNGTEDVIQPQKRGDLPVSAENLQIVRDAMHGVTSDRNGTAAFVFEKLPISTAGKTGTAQVPGAFEPHAWFAGFAPAEDPQIACCVMVENGGEGSKVSAPIFRKVIEKYFKVQPTPSPKGTVTGPTPTPPPSE